MGTRRFVQGAVAIAVAGLVWAPDAGAQDRRYPEALVAASRQVTTDPMPARAHAVPDLAVHPADHRIVAMGHGEARSAQCFLSVSRNSGASWITTPIELSSKYPKCVYSNLGPIVDVAFGADGTLYYAYSGFDPATYQSRIYLLRSADLGLTFSTTELPWVGPALQANPPQFGADALPQIAIDPNRPERVYVGWMTNNGTWNLSNDVRGGKRYFYEIFSRPYVAASDDGGVSFAPAVDVGPAIVAGDPRQGWMSEPHLVVGRDGAVHVFFGENMRPLPEGSTEKAPPASLWMARSTDSGGTYETSAIYTREPKARDWLAGPSPGVDPRSGDLYVVWDDQPVQDGKARVAFMRSTDGGTTWSDPLQLNDVEPGRPWNFCQFCPSLSVAPDGRIDVAWYDWRNDPGFNPAVTPPVNRYQDVYYTYSDDGGVTWSPDTRVTDRQIDRSIGVFSTQGLRGNIGLASAPDTALIAWDDTRNGSEQTQSQDIYFTQVWPDGGLTVVDDGDATPPLLWVLLGSAIALGVGGAVLFVAQRAYARSAGPRRRAVPQT